MGNWSYNPYKWSSNPTTLLMIYLVGAVHLRFFRVYPAKYPPEGSSETTNLFLLNLTNSHHRLLNTFWWESYPPCNIAPENDGWKTTSLFGARPFCRCELLVLVSILGSLSKIHHWKAGSVGFFEALDIQTPGE